MQNISDIIEEFIMSTLGEDPELNLSRNYLAQFFNCAPSQINYVLQTRFNVNRGFITESQRGGGGYIKLVRLDLSGDDYIKIILNERIDKPITYKDAMFLADDLEQKAYITNEQKKIIGFALHPKALNMPIKMEDVLRAQILKNILTNILGGQLNA